MNLSSQAKLYITKLIDTDQMGDFTTTTAITPDTSTIRLRVVILLLRKVKPAGKAKSHIRITNADLLARLVDLAFQY